MTVKIISDSTCDLSPELLRQYDVSITPLSVCCGERVGADGTEITPDDIYEYVHAEGKLPQTSAVNVADYMEEFHRWTKQGCCVVHFCISSDFSSTYQNACLAAKEVGNVFVVDSRNLSTGQGLLAYIAKPEIFDIPITGRIVHKCFFLPINRTDNREALGTIKYAAKLLQKGVVSFGIYPEGTRSKTGELLPFRNGAFQIARRAGAPIVIAKTSGTELIAHRFARKRTIVRFDVLDVLEGSAVSKLPTREIGDYAQSLMLGDIQTTPTEKETNL